MLCENVFADNMPSVKIAFRNSTKKNRYSLKGNPSTDNRKYQHSELYHFDLE